MSTSKKRRRSLSEEEDTYDKRTRTSREGREAPDIVELLLMSYCNFPRDVASLVLNLSLDFVQDNGGNYIYLFMLKEAFEDGVTHRERNTILDHISHDQVDYYWTSYMKGKAQAKQDSKHVHSHSCGRYVFGNDCYGPNSPTYWCNREFVQCMYDLWRYRSLCYGTGEGEQKQRKQAYAPFVAVAVNRKYMRAIDIQVHVPEVYQPDSECPEDGCPCENHRSTNEAEGVVERYIRVNLQNGLYDFTRCVPDLLEAPYPFRMDQIKGFIHQLKMEDDKLRATIKKHRSIVSYSSEAAINMPIVEFEINELLSHINIDDVLHVCSLDELSRVLKTSHCYDELCKLEQPNITCWLHQPD